MTEIVPTVGRVVWYRPEPSFAGPHDMREPLAAIIAKVWAPPYIALMVIDAGGNTWGRHQVPLWNGPVQLEGGGWSEPPERPYAEWMPYQLGQAAKTEEAERAREARLAPHQEDK
jgi:hypothetical protein